MKNPRLHKMSAMSLVELLIVMAIISLLVQLTIPAVQAAREAARRTQCQNNMRQLGLAAQNYESAHRLLPPGWVREEKLDHNHVQFLLPYIEMAALHQQYDFKVSWNDKKNEPLTRVEIPTVRCPTAPQDHPFISDYAVYMGVREAYNKILVDEKILQPRENTDGALRGKPTPSAQVVDGISNTIFLCEMVGRPDKYHFGGRPVSGKVDGSRWASPVGRFEINGRCNGTKFHVGSQVVNCTNNNEIFSFHPQGANFLYGDASVQLLSEDIDPDVLVTMLTAKAND